MNSSFSAAEQPDNKNEVAEQIALEASRLARLANAYELRHLAHLMDMAVLEAWREATEAGGGDSGD